MFKKMKQIQKSDLQRLAPLIHRHRHPNLLEHGLTLLDHSRRIPIRRQQAHLGRLLLLVGDLLDSFNLLQLVHVAQGAAALVKQLELARLEAVASQNGPKVRLARQATNGNGLVQMARLDPLEQQLRINWNNGTNSSSRRVFHLDLGAAKTDQTWVAPERVDIVEGNNGRLVSRDL